MVRVKTTNQRRSWLGTWLAIFSMLIPILILVVGKPIQVAKATTAHMILFWDGGTAPTGWTEITGSGQAFDQVYPRGAATYGGTGGSNTVSHSYSYVSETPASSTTQGPLAGGNVSSSVHNHGAVSGGVTSPRSTLPASYSLEMIRCDTAGEPATIPSGAIALFESTSDYDGSWTLQTGYDNKYIYGHSTAAATQGAATSTQTWLSLSVGAASAPVAAAGGLGTAGTTTHTHTIGTLTTPAVNNDPLSTLLNFSKANTNITGTPTSMVAMWDDTPDANWDVKSDSGGELYYQNLLVSKSNSTATNAGNSTATPSNTSATTGNPVGTTAAAASNKALWATSTHTHSITFSFDAQSTYPAYKNVIIAKRTGDPVFTPKAKNWRIYDGETTATPTSALAAENTANTDANIGYKLNLFKLRMTIKETTGGSQSNIRYKLRFSTDESSWTDVATTGSCASTAWCYAGGGGTDDATLPSRLLTDSDTTGTHNETNTGSTYDHAGGTSVEFEYTLNNNNATANTTYYFQAYDTVNAAQVALDTSETHPSILTASAYTLILSAPAAVNLSAYTLGSGSQQTYNFSTPTEDITVWDRRGTGVGWSLTVSSTDLDRQSSPPVDAIDNADMTWTTNTLNVRYASDSTGMSTANGTLNNTVGTILANSSQGLGGFYIDPTLTLANVNLRYAGTYAGTLTLTLI